MNSAHVGTLETKAEINKMQSISANSIRFMFLPNFAIRKTSTLLESGNTVNAEAIPKDPRIKKRIGLENPERALPNPGETPMRGIIPRVTQQIIERGRASEIKTSKKAMVKPIVRIASVVRPSTPGIKNEAIRIISEDATPILDFM